MSAVRFATVQDLYEAFATAEQDIEKPAGHFGSIEFLHALTTEKEWPAAISFCAYLLPRRAAVAWGCRSIRTIMPPQLSNDDKGLAFAEAWVSEPQELQRRKALALGNQADKKLPSTWLALAAGWSGGSVVPVESGHIPARPEQTPRAVRTALMIARSRLPAAKADAILAAWIDDGVKLARGNAS